MSGILIWLMESALESFREAYFGAPLHLPVQLLNPRNRKNPYLIPVKKNTSLAWFARLRLGNSSLESRLRLHQYLLQIKTNVFAVVFA